MSKKIHDTIIIGAGIAGLACARKLHENNKEFLVVSEDIGGRCGKYSKGDVPYGAYFVMKNFHHVKKFVKIKRRIKIGKILIHKGKQNYHFWGKMLLSYPLQLMKLVYLLFIFNNHYEAFKKKCETISQAKAMKSDPFLWKLYNKKASVFFKEQNLKETLEDTICPLAHSILGPSPHKANAFIYLQWTLSLITSTYEFIFLKDKMINGFRKNIIFDTVVQIKKKKDFYVIKTKKRVICAKNVVVATPPPVSEKLLHLKKPDIFVKAHMFHVSGRLRESYDQIWPNSFPMSSPVHAVASQTDGAFMFVSRNKIPKFENYFYKYKIINHKFWNPAFIGRKIPLESEQDKNLYLIGDLNFPSLEDAYITGIYAANRIIKG